MKIVTNVLIAVFVFAATVVAAPPQYSVQSLGALTAQGRGPYDYRSFQIDDSGAVLGQSQSGGHSQASLWRAGVITPLGTWGNGTYSYGFAFNNSGTVAAELDDQFVNRFAGAKTLTGSWTSGLYTSGVQFTSPRGINSLNQLVGVGSASTFEAFPLRAFFHPGVDGNARPILLPNSSGAISSAAFGISSNGYIAGNVGSTTNTPIAAAWRRITNTQYEYGTLDVVGSTALGVNAAGTFVGYSSTGASQWSLSTGLKTTFYPTGVATAINAEGFVVGNTILSNVLTDPNSRAIVYYPGGTSVYDLTSLLVPGTGWVLYSASAVNSSGQIVGYGNLGGYILTPTCYANCDQSATAPVLTANDFVCFLNSFSQSSPSANCDGSAVPPVLTANDFTCFLSRFATGCP